MKNRKNILVLTQWSYKDPLIQAYTLPYIYIIAKNLPEGSKIFLVTYEQDSKKMSKDERNSVVSKLNGRGIILIDYTYSKFGILSLLKWFLNLVHLLFIIVTKKIKFIHAWCTPAGTLGYLLSIITGKPLIVDSYEPHAEAMVENKTWKSNSIKFKVLFYFEKKLSKHATTIISATEGMREYARKKYDAIISDFHVKPACVDLIDFNILKRKNDLLLKKYGLDGKIVCVYAGKFGGIYLTKEVFDFFKECENIFGEKFRVFLLTTQDKNLLSEWAINSGFDTSKIIIEYVPHDKIPDYIGLGDFGITPVKPIPTKKYCTPIKDGEYWALGLPVVITKEISDDSGIIERNRAGAIINELSSTGYRTAIHDLEKILLEPKEETAIRISALAKKYRSFEIAENIYKKIYN